MKQFLLIIILCILLIIMLAMNINVYEEFPSLPDMQTNVQVSDIDSLRYVLESLYAVCYSNPNGVVGNNIQNTLCYKSYLLGTMIPSSLSSLAKQDMEKLWSIYGQAAIPTGIKEIAPIKIPVLSTIKDYTMLQQLCTAGDGISTYITANPRIWKQFINNATSPPQTNTRDLCLNEDDDSKAKVKQVNILFNKIYDSLKYFHSQLDTSLIVHRSDSADTTFY